ncbi:MAG TPA: hypothetical protein VLX85_04495 [Stellaceae bacterium]|nr:hypothetical protein [Stellaceae bacterium]
MFEIMLNDPVLIAVMTLAAGWIVAHAAGGRRMRPVRIERRNIGRPSVPRRATG